MSKAIRCCVNNLRQFQYGATLQALADAGGDVKLERCLSFCIGCRSQRQASIDGKLMYAADETAFARMLGAAEEAQAGAEAAAESATEPEPEPELELEPEPEPEQ